MERITVKNISKKFRIGFSKHQRALLRIISFFSGREPRKDFWALKDVSFSARAGDCVGIIGRNGCGKSTLLRVIARIYCKDKGILKTKGKIIPLISLGGGFHRILSMKDNIYYYASIFGMRKNILKAVLILY